MELKFSAINVCRLKVLQVRKKTYIFLIHLFPGFAESKVLAVGMPIASIAINSTTAKVNRIASK